MSWNASPVVITVAPTGAEVTRDQAPALPHTPEEIARESIASAAAGAAMVHLHMREPDGTPSSDPELFERTIQLTRADSDMVTMVSTGGSVEMSVDERLGGLSAAPDVAGVETGSLNFGDDVFITSRPDGIRVIEIATTQGIALEVEAFDVGHVVSAVDLHDRGLLPGPLRFNLVFGVPGGIDASPEALAAMLRPIPHDATWTVTAIGRHQQRMLALALLHGANGVRVGFEDNIYVGPKVVASSNAELVAGAAELVRSLGREVATPTQAREIFQLGAT